jgi:hypothetical protein
MMLRQITAVLLGVLLQVGLFGAIPFACAAPETLPQQSCCCDGAAQCPCIEAGDDQKPSVPAIPLGQERLTPLITPAEPAIIVIDNRVDTTASSPALSRIEPFVGHSGVALRVSFCRYAI